MTGIDVPTFRRIAEDIRRRLDAGEWSPGARIPSEAQLSAEYRCARETVRRAKRVLCGDGVVLVKTTGTYVRLRPPVNLIHAPLGGRVGVRMPTEAECAGRDIPEGVPVLVVTDVDGRAEVYPGDATEVAIPLPRRKRLTFDLDGNTRVDAAPGVSGNGGSDGR